MLRSAAAPTVASPARSRRKRSRPEPFTIVSYLVVGTFAVFSVLPLWMILAGSFTDESALAVSGYSLFPAPFSLEAYKQIFSGTAVLNAYTASIFITVVGTILSAAFTAALAWTIARRVGALSRIAAIYSYIPMLFTGGLVPMYLLVTYVLQLRDSWWAVILPGLMAPFLVFIAVASFQQLPAEILESARVDGAGELRIFFTIVLPLSKPIIAVVALFYGVAYWNEWFHALLFLTDTDKFPLQLVLQNLIANVTSSAELPGSISSSPPVYQMRLALTVITIGPIVLAYPFAQRYFVKGLTLGATKG